MKKLLIWSLLALGACLGWAAPSFADAFGVFYCPSYCCKARYPSQPANAFSCLCTSDNAFTDYCVFNNAFTPPWCNNCCGQCAGCGWGHGKHCLAGWWKANCFSGCGLFGHKCCGQSDCGQFDCCPSDCGAYECAGGGSPYSAAYDSFAAVPAPPVQPFPQAAPVQPVSYYAPAYPYGYGYGPAPAYQPAQAPAWEVPAYWSGY
jgi:hypothetical protein